MAKHDIFGRLAQQVGERLQDVSRGPEDIQRTVQSAMRSAFDRMELVSREDFDVMMEVLQRTRSRVEDLERQVTRLEAALDERDGGSASGAAAASEAASTTAEAERLAGEHDAPAAAVDSAATGSAKSRSSTAADKSASGSKSGARTTRGSGKRVSGSEDQSGQGTAD